MDSKDSSDYITRFKEAIVIAGSLRLEKEKIRHYRDSKQILKKLNRYDDQERTRLRDAMKDMRSVSEVKRQRLDDLRDGIIREMTSKLVDATNIEGRLNKSLVPPDDMSVDNAFDMQPYLQQVNHIKQELVELNSEKADRLQLIQEIENCKDRVRTELQSFYEQSILEYEPVKEKYISDLNNLDCKLRGFDHDALVDKVSNMLLGLPLSKKERIASMVVETVRDMFGKNLIELVIADRSQKDNIYPSEVNSLQIREANSEEIKSKILYKTDIMKKELDKILLAVEDVPKIEHLIGNLGYADHITKNHTQVLNFLNAPDGIVNKIPYVNEAEVIPPEISLNEQNVNLSTALTASLTQHAKNHFSDLEERLNRLEKKMEQ
ncbi:hypothetical protein HPULCUR_006440 [Helicostylum pulchrum]|uniref:Coiled coil protein n=1 Tax=Helicostylum pulchrum TaxID=562976 RepID=A0ABP9Y1X3_9FUNG